MEETTNSVTPVKKSQVSAFSARQPVQHMPIHVGELQSKRMGKNSEFSISEVIEGTLRKAQKMTLIDEEMQGQMDGAIGAQGRENMSGAGLCCERSDVDAKEQLLANSCHNLSRIIQQPSTQYSSQLDPFTSLHAERDELGYSPILPGLLAHETPRTKALTDALLPIASPIELQLIEFVTEFDLSVSESETDKSETEKSKLDVGDVQLSVDNNGDVSNVQASEVRCWRSPDLQLREEQQERHLEMHLPASLLKVQKECHSAAALQQSSNRSETAASAQLLAAHLQELRQVNTQLAHENSTLLERLEQIERELEIELRRGELERLDQTEKHQIEKHQIEKELAAATSKTTLLHNQLHTLLPHSLPQLPHSLPHPCTRHTEVRVFLLHMYYIYTERERERERERDVVK